MKVWVTRDIDDSDDSVTERIKMWERKPTLYEGEQFYDMAFPRCPGWQIMGVRDFEEAFGFLPPQGSCEEYRLSMEKI